MALDLSTHLQLTIARPALSNHLSTNKSRLTAFEKLTASEDLNSDGLFCLVF